MLLTFKKQFVPKILDGTKIHTLRRPRKYMAKIDEPIYMYMDLRTNHAEQIPGEYIVKSIQRVHIHIRWDMNGSWIKNKWTIFSYMVVIDGRILSDAEVIQFAMADGFPNVHSLFQFIADSYIQLPTAPYRKDPDYFTFSIIMDLYHWTDFQY